MISTLVAAVAALAFAPQSATLSLHPFASGFDSPVYVAAPASEPGKLYVVEQPGVIRLVANGRPGAVFLDIRSRVKSGGEQGLLSVAFHPGYAKNHRFYVDYTDTNGDTRVVEFRSDGTKGIPSSARQLLFVKQPYPNHNGGQLQFDRLGYLYVGMGDGGAGGDPQNRSQNPSTRLGKLLRINPTRTGASWQMVGLGLRNPWRYSFDRANGNLWIADVGQNTWEEVDFRARANVGKLANYGWPRFEGRAFYDASRRLSNRGVLTRPVAVYSHTDGCSITGGYVYRGAAVPAARGRYFFGDYCSGTIWSKAGPGGAVRREPMHVDNLTSWGEDAAGELYAVSGDGAIFRLAP
jgi:glucose/arabinose dehydrogenase